MFSSLGEILDAPDIERGRRGARTGEPVRRHSRAAGRCEGVFWRRTDRKETQRILLAARRYEVTTRQPGARSGALGFVALEVLELFANLVDFRTGRLEPSLDYLMAKLHRSRDAIHRALRALRAHGFLDWLRRYVPTGNEGRGPQVQQTSNAYRLSMPARALRLLGRYGQAAPVPDDHSHAQEQRTADLNAQLASATVEEEMAFRFGADDPLGKALAALKRSIVQRESAKRTESHPSSISKGK